MRQEPFTIAVPESVLADLAGRLARARLSPDFANDDWGYGTNGAYLGELVAYWTRDYDWRRHERAMNAFSHFRVTIDEVPIHFIHERGKGPKPLPLVINHGWPWTFWDMQKIIRPLTDPAAFGGDPADAFDIVAPSLPGFGFSTPLTKPGINFWRTADLWATLMRDVLGYDRFGAQGGDWGAFVAAQLGHKYGERLIGVHLHFMPPLDAYMAPLPAASEYAPEERERYERNERFVAGEMGYSAMHITKPQTLAAALNDSPVGLCSWILEKRRSWGDCGGNVESRFSKDDLLTTVMLYWVTESFNTSARYYAEAVRDPWRPVRDSLPWVEVPTGAVIFKNEVIVLPRQWIESHYNIQRYTTLDSGGHFAPMEEPEALVNEIRAFFRPLR